MKRRVGVLATLASVATALTLTAGPAPAGATAASSAALGHRSLAAVLTSDGNRFDHNRRDFDITTEAVLAVLKAKPDSPVGVLTKGKTALTAFVPTDAAFHRLADDLFGRSIPNERKLFATLVKKLGVDTIEAVLLYHVVPGKTLTSRKVLAADGARVPTAAGATVRVDVRKRPRLHVVLKDKDRNDRDARVVLGAIDLNRGNKQVAHGVDRVLRPADL
jgi:hypothetical protein